MAEIELSVRTRPCRDRRIEPVDPLLEELEPWEQERNDQGIGVGCIQVFLGQAARFQSAAH